MHYHSSTCKKGDFQSSNKEKTSQQVTHITPLIECIDLKRISVETIMISMKYIYVKCFPNACLQWLKSYFLNELTKYRWKFYKLDPKHISFFTMQTCLVHNANIILMGNLLLFLHVVESTPCMWTINIDMEN